MLRWLCLALATLALSGCAARAAWDVATAPVRATAKAVDWATTSQDEADRNRGRAIRKAEERERRAARRAAPAPAPSF